MASVASVINGVSNIANRLFDLSPSLFYSIRDFYNFIKKPLNCPMNFKHFTVVPKALIYTIDGGIPAIWDKLFTDTNLAKFAILTQSIDIPELSIDGTSTQVKNPFGSYALERAGKIGASNATFTMSFLSTASPIVETFIIPWLYESQRNINKKQDASEHLLWLSSITNQDVTNFAENAVNSITNKLGMGNVFKTKSGQVFISQSRVPKLTIDIKYYRMDEISGLSFIMNPTFVYRFTGVYPVSISPRPALYGVGAGGEVDKRRVTFAFNNFYCLPNAYWLKALTGNYTGFAYQDMSPIQILNSLNNTVGGVMLTISDVKGMM